jgi:hypothetical protein
VNIPDDRVITVAFLREFLGLPAFRLDGVRDLLVVARDPGAPVPAIADRPWRLALGEWPESWRDAPETGPRYLVMLRGLTAPSFIATVEDIYTAGWGTDGDGELERRVVPVSGTAYATAFLAGCRLDADVTFGWPLPEEQFAFM